jgi:hypothetical protein
VLTVEMTVIFRLNHQVADQYIAVIVLKSMRQQMTIEDVVLIEVEIDSQKIDFLEIPKVVVIENYLTQYVQNVVTNAEFLLDQHKEKKHYVVNVLKTKAEILEQSQTVLQNSSMKSTQN